MTRAITVTRKSAWVTKQCLIKCFVMIRKCCLRMSRDYAIAKTVVSICLFFFESHTFIEFSRCWSMGGWTPQLCFIATALFFWGGKNIYCHDGATVITESSSVIDINVPPREHIC